ncbi:sensor histidine kinase [Aquimonas voraii]|uniref:histidine kinase n=1 Tax=Aquimonas voraii TaxID=265719 RepID=A0A1G6XNG4_9GAMM|nr:HAMP domain-containing sensor histidine kinase [Aquimonas voraii]SDD79602.1 Signal transduction histidine kinase [Aquimonas voraii]
MRISTGLRRKIWAAFILQIAAISCATVLGVYGASAVLKDVLIQRALTDEAAHFRARLARDPTAMPPDTYNMQGYLQRHGESENVLPENLRGLVPGYYSLPAERGGSLVLVQEGEGGTLLLVFDAEQVNALAFFFGAVPLVLVLVVIYIIAWATYRISRRAVSPVIWLAGVVQHWDPKKPNLEALSPEQLPLDVEGEVLVLAQALHEFASRIDAFVQRERDFTRDASHELRSPLTVIRIACDMLCAEDELPPYAKRQIKRILGSARDMEGLIESFLILAREGDADLPEEDFVINEVVADEVEKVRPLLGEKPVDLRVEEHAAFSLHGSPRVLRVILSNLIRNACAYTEQGSVVVHIHADHVCVQDTGCGMTPEELERAFDPFFRGGMRKEGGQGVGLTIVRRLSTRFGWPVTLESEAGKGTCARVRFPAVSDARTTAALGPA